MASNPKHKESEKKPLSKQEFYTQAKLFTDYINYDWDSDKTWLAFMNANKETVAEESDKEQSRREFFKQHFQGKFDTSFYLKNESEKERFIEFVKFNNTLTCLSAVSER